MKRNLSVIKCKVAAKLREIMLKMDICNQIRLLDFNGVIYLRPKHWPFMGDEILYVGGGEGERL